MIGFINARTHELEQQWPLETRSFRRRAQDISVSEDLATLAHAAENGTVKIWDTATREATELKVADGFVETAVLFSQRAGAGDFKPRTQSPLGDWRAGTSTAIAGDAQRIHFARDGRTMVAMQRGGTVLVWGGRARGAV